MISRASEHAIRAMTYLAQREREGLHLARVMADELRIPGAFLAKILQSLVARELIVSQRGRSGGFRLARPPGDITLFEIVDAQEHLDDAPTCLLGQAECSDERACPLHRYWKRTSGEFLEVLHGTRLSSLVEFCADEPGSGYPAPARDPG